MPGSRNPSLFLPSSRYPQVIQVSTRPSPGVIGSWDPAPPGPGRPSASAIPRPTTPASRTVALGLARRPAACPFPHPALQQRPPRATRLLPAPRPQPAYPPARLFRFTGGGQAGRRGRLWSPRPGHALPAQGPPGAGPLPVVIPGWAQTRARARTLPPRPTPRRRVLALVLALAPAPVRVRVRRHLVLHSATSSREKARHSLCHTHTHTHRLPGKTQPTRCSAGWVGECV